MPLSQLQQSAPAVYERYKADDTNRSSSSSRYGLDGAKVGVLDDNGKELARVGDLLQKEGKTDKNQETLADWWQQAKETATADKTLVTEAIAHGDRMALKLTSIIPVVMAGLFLCLILLQGNWRLQPIHISSEQVSGQRSEPVQV